VFSIAATLLVLAIAVHPPGTPLQPVLRAWPGAPGVRRQLSDDLHCLAGPHGIDRPARAVRSDLLALRELAGRSLAASST